MRDAWSVEVLKFQTQTHPALHAVLDLSRPVAILLISALHFAPDAEAIVRPLIDAAAPGSYVVLTHLSKNLLPAHRRGLQPGRRGDVVP